MDTADDTPRCTSCTRQLRDHETGQYLCLPCVRTIRAWLSELPAQMTVLRGSMQRETVGVPVRSSRATPPIPPREDTLNLTGPCAPGHVTDPHGDQEGPVPIVGTLGAWARLILEESPNAPAPAAWTELGLADWLADRLGWCARQPWSGEMRGELWDMISLVRHITRVRPQKRPVPRPCPRCGLLLLTKEDHDLYVRCGNQACEAVYTEAELNADAVQRAAQAAAA